VTLLTLIALFTRPWDAQLCTRLLERKVLSYSTDLRSGGNALYYLCALLYLGGLGSRSSQRSIPNNLGLDEVA